MKMLKAKALQSTADLECHLAILSHRAAKTTNQNQAKHDGSLKGCLRVSSYKRTGTKSTDGSRQRFPLLQDEALRTSMDVEQDRSCVAMKSQLLDVHKATKVPSLLPRQLEGGGKTFDSSFRKDFCLNKIALDHRVYGIEVSNQGIAGGVILHCEKDVREEDGMTFSGRALSHANSAQEVSVKSGCVELCIQSRQEDLDVLALYSSPGSCDAADNGTKVNGPTNYGHSRTQNCTISAALKPDEASIGVSSTSKPTDAVASVDAESVGESGKNKLSQEKFDAVESFDGAEQGQNWVQPGSMKVASSAKEGSWPRVLVEAVPIDINDSTQASETLDSNHVGHESENMKVTADHEVNRGSKTVKESTFVLEPEVAATHVYDSLIEHPLGDAVAERSTSACDHQSCAKSAKEITENTCRATEEELSGEETGMETTLDGDKITIGEPVNQNGGDVASAFQVDKTISGDSTANTKADMVGECTDFNDGFQPVADDCAIKQEQVVGRDATAGLSELFDAKYINCSDEEEVPEPEAAPAIAPAVASSAMHPLGDFFKTWISAPCWFSHSVESENDDDFLDEIEDIFEANIAQGLLSYDSFDSVTVTMYTESVMQNNFEFDDVEKWESMDCKI